jgi:hypothetical protein
LIRRLLASYTKRGVGDVIGAEAGVGLGQHHRIQHPGRLDPLHRIVGSTDSGWWSYGMTA